MAFTEKLNPQWVTNGISEDAINWSDRFAKYLAPRYKDDKEALSTSQLRKFFGQLRRIEADYEKLKFEIPLLKPKLAYAVGRAKGKEPRIKDFYEQMLIGFSSLRDKKDNFTRLINLTESIVAFHKFHGGE